MPFGCKHRPPARHWLLVALSAPLLLVSLRPLQAQDGSASGIVVAEATSQPLPGAQVVVAGTGRGTITRADGRFLLVGLRGTEVTVQVTMLGYRSVTRAVRVGDHELRIALVQAAIPLDELVVTGTAGEVQRRALGNVVTQVNAAQAVEIAPIPNLQSLINARAPGVVIMPGTGMIGSGARIRVRGASSLALSNEPLIYVDGVRVDNAQGTGPTVQAFGSSVISRWNDFNPEDIESIEIIKGPAAATLYGTEASNGVIQVITKRGAVGAPTFHMTVRQGANWFDDPEGRVWTNFWRNPTTKEVETLNLIDAENARGTPIFTTGHLQGYSLSLNGGAQDVRYYVSGDYDREEGVEPENMLKRLSGRFNLTLYPRDDLDISASLGYVASRTDLVFEAGGGGATWGSYFSTPQNLNENLPAGAPPRRGFRSFTTDAYYDIFDNWQEVSRLTGSLRFQHRATEWLNHRLTIGTDETREDNQSLTLQGEQLQTFSPGGLGGKTVARRDVSYNTVDYSATASLQLRPDVSSNTSVGWQYYRKFSEFVTADGSGFALPGLEAINATATRSAGETFIENVTVGFFAQQQLGWKNRVFVTGGLRADDNSAFGENFDLVYYPKASATWVVSEEPFFHLPVVNTLRFRSAYGQTGVQPDAFAALRTFATATGPGDVATVTPGSAGNPDLGPERGEEIELGFDAGLFDERVGLEFTYYDKKTKDGILLKDVAPSTGFAGSQFVNIGEVKNKGFEIMLRGQAYRGRSASVDLSFGVAKNSSEVIDLGGPDRLVESAAFGVEHRVGGPMGGWYHVRIVSAELDSVGTAIRATMLCDGGPENDGPVPCFTGSTVTAPRVFLGQTLPKYEGAFSSTVTLWDRLRLYALVDFKTGYHKWDHNLRVRCSLFLVCRENVFPLEGNPIEVAAYQNADRFGAEYINDASFAKLREVSVSYTLPDLWATRIGASRASISLAGRNLHTWTKWEGMEPEAMFLSGGRAGFTQIEQDNLPQLTQFVTTINLTF